MRFRSAPATIADTLVSYRLSASSATALDLSRDAWLNSPLRWVPTECPNMKFPKLHEQTAASLRRQLDAAPTELRAMATAEKADWQTPDFQTDEDQQEAIYALLRACIDARTAVFGQHPDSDLDDDDQAHDAARLRQWVATERSDALSHAIADGVRAGRLLRQRGVKAAITTTERIDSESKTILARAELHFRCRSTRRGAA